MNKLTAITVCSLACAFGSSAFAQSTPPSAPSAAGTSAVQSEMVRGWGVKNNLIGKSVYNEQDEKIGDIRDVILDAKGTATHYVLGVGGFLGMGEHDVSLPFSELQPGKDRFTLQGYTKDRLKELPQWK
ncbi:PRC-barrel domain-containing protein [Paenalcaligenes faecalis]|uniref:PRC-barrel domain-containing protein n=1 Tax=Paenalcaligenes faecalis TaxID=2980099 RepID=UPI0022B98BA6|nr:PRC-barrel domain-containing protein [Paenalcaligenes faecalis]